MTPLNFVVEIFIKFSIDLMHPNNQYFLLLGDMWHHGGRVSSFLREMAFSHDPVKTIILSPRLSRHI